MYNTLFQVKSIYKFFYRKHPVFCQFLKLERSKGMEVWHSDFDDTCNGLEVELGKTLDSYFFKSPNLQLGVENTLYVTEFWRFEAWQ